MVYYSPCPLCGREATKSPFPDGTKIDCEQCGHFDLTGTAEKVLSNLDQRQKMKIGFWTRDQNDLGDTPKVASFTFDEVKKIPDKTLMERAERLLRFGIAEQQDLGGTFKLPSAKAAGISHSKSDPEVIALADFLREQGWLAPDKHITSGYAQVSPHGFIHATEANVTESVNGFFAMWFDPSMNTARTDGLEPAIRNAGYTPLIVSGVEHINKIDDEIVSQIRRSKFLVADFTGHRGGDSDKSRGGPLRTLIRSGDIRHRNTSTAHPTSSCGQ
jgi:hypothetical protein